MSPLIPSCTLASAPSESATGGELGSAGNSNRPTDQAVGSGAWDAPARRGSLRLRFNCAAMLAAKPYVVDARRLYTPGSPGPAGGSSKSRARSKTVDRRPSKSINDFPRKTLRL